MSLPKAFANTTLLIEQISDTELRIRKAQVVPEDEMLFAEEAAVPLTERDRDLFLSLLEKPPAANSALKKALGKKKGKRG